MGRLLGNAGAHQVSYRGAAEVVSNHAGDAGRLAGCRPGPAEALDPFPVAVEHERAEYAAKPQPFVGVPLALNHIDELGQQVVG